MVDFIRPNLLGSIKDFTNRFVNPISNGQYSDSTPQDVRLMKRRSHVLHRMLEGFVQVIIVCYCDSNKLCSKIKVFELYKLTFKLVIFILLNNFKFLIKGKL